MIIMDSAQMQNNPQTNDWFLNFGGKHTTRLFLLFLNLQGQLKPDWSTRATQIKYEVFW